MEMGCLTFTTTPAIPWSSSSHRTGAVKHHLQSTNNHHQFSVPTSSGSRTVRRRPLSVKASNSDKSSSILTPQSLSSHWDVSNYTAPAWWPQFEDLDSTNMLLRQRIVFLGSQVEDVSADFIISQLLLLDQQDPTKDIKLFINSPGGSVTAGLGIYDAMKMCKADISTICVGLAASMGAFLLASGTKGKRFCMPNCRVMIHGAQGGVEGSPTEILIRHRELIYLGKKLNKTLARITGKTYEQIREDTMRDNFMNSWEAVAYGLADGVIDDGKPGLVAPIVDAVPPPRARICDFFKVEPGWQGMENLPSEEKFLLE